MTLVDGLDISERRTWRWGPGIAAPLGLVRQRLDREWGRSYSLLARRSKARLGDWVEQGLSTEVGAAITECLVAPLERPSLCEDRAL